MVGKAAEGRCTLGRGPVVSEVLGRIGDRTTSEQYMDVCLCTWVHVMVSLQKCVCVCVYQVCSELS